MTIGTNRAAMLDSAHAAPTNLPAAARHRPLDFQKMAAVGSFANSQSICFAGSNRQRVRFTSAGSPLNRGAYSPRICIRGCESRAKSTEDVDRRSRNRRKAAGSRERRYLTASGCHQDLEHLRRPYLVRTLVTTDCFIPNHHKLLF